MKLNEGMESFMLNGVTMKINIDEYILNAIERLDKCTIQLQ